MIRKPDAGSLAVNTRQRERYLIPDTRLAHLEIYNHLTAALMHSCFVGGRERESRRGGVIETHSHSIELHDCDTLFPCGERKKAS